MVLGIFGGVGGVKAAPRKEKKYVPPFKKDRARNIMIPRVFFNLVSGSRHREALGFAPLLNYFPIFPTSLKDRTGIAPDNAQVLQEA